MPYSKFFVLNKILIVWVFLYVSIKILGKNQEYILNLNTEYTKIENKRIIIENYNQDQPISLLRPNFESEIKNITKSNNLGEVTKAHVKKVLDILQKNQVVLLDVECFENQEVCKKLDKYFSTGQDLHLAFGVSIDSYEELNQALREEFSGIFEFSYVTQNFRKNHILTGVYLHDKNIHLQISILYSRGDFLWIGKDSYTHASKKFGDKPRAINKFEIVRIEYKDSNVFNIPSNLKKYTYDYAHSNFKECDVDMAMMISKSYKQDKKKNEKYYKKMKYVTEKLESMNIHYWLSCGSLLGWYRECGVIPFTHDIDFNVWAHEYNRSYVDFFKGNKNLWLTMTLGYPENNYELRLQADGFTIDVFYTYKVPNNDSVQWNTYQLGKKVWRQYLPSFNELCSAELLDSKFLVPCDPVQQLNADYGPNGWQTPKSKSNLKKETKDSYTWPSLKFFNTSSDAEFLKSVRFYTINGSIDNKTTFNFLNGQLDKKISSDEFFNLKLT